MHLPLMEFGDEGLSLDVRRARSTPPASGLAAISANDHFLFPTPWLDGPTALAAAVERSGGMELATTVASSRSAGRWRSRRRSPRSTCCRAVTWSPGGPGSSERDYRAAGIPWDDRWSRFEQAVIRLREPRRRRLSCARRRDGRAGSRCGWGLRRG